MIKKLKSLITNPLKRFDLSEEIAETEVMDEEDLEKDAKEKEKERAEAENDGQRRRKGEDEAIDVEEEEDIKITGLLRYS